MKIGIVSYNREPNYGTMLQAYALAHAIQGEGVSCAYIDYRFRRVPFWHSAALGVLYFLGLRQKGEFAFFDTKPFSRIKQKFAAFHKAYVPVSEKAYYADNITDALNDFDTFVVGSDQTWSPMMNRNPYSINFLPFVDEPHRKNAYAPSIGTISVDKAFGERLKQALVSFRHISCRERQNCDYLMSLLGKPVRYVLDPTLLLTAKDWDSIAVRPQMPRHSYVLAYILGEKSCISSFAEKLGKDMGLPVYYVATRPLYLQRDNVLNAVGPQEFVGLIRDAAAVVTDSFHGTLFSINYGVEFYSFAKRECQPGEITNDNARILAFLQELGLEHRFKQDDDTTFASPIEYHAIHEWLDAMRDESRKYLLQIIK